MSKDYPCSFLFPLKILSIHPGINNVYQNEHMFNSVDK